MKFCGARLKEARQAHGLTQEELGAKVGVSKYTILRAEGDKFQPRGATAMNLAAALGLDISDLYVTAEAPAA